MKLKDLLKIDELKLLTDENNIDIEYSDIYIGDLLSWVMGKGKTKAVWLTVLSHQNIIAVASLREFSAVVICEGAKVEDELISLANREGINIFTSSLPIYETSKLIA